MSTLYERIDGLCKAKGVTHGKMCDDLGYSRNTMAALKSGRSKTLKLEKAQRIAEYFDVSVDYLLNADTEKAPIQLDGRQISEQEIRVAMMGGGSNITDAMWQEVKNFAAYIVQREKGKEG